MPESLLVPSVLSGLEAGSISDTGSATGQDLSVPRFPHTRAQLSSIARQHKPLEGYDSDAEGDDTTRVSSSLVNKVVALLDGEHEDELKALLKDAFGVDNDMVEQHVLDLMHKHRDDVAGVPFLFLTPTRRPSRPSSRASSHSVRVGGNRPDTPNSVPSSPLAIAFRRPHTPATSPLAGGAGVASSYMSARSESPMNSPTFAHAQATQAYNQFTSSLPSSPLSSPRLLNAKASEFKPIPRPLSAASSNPSSFPGYRTETPSPDLWAHNSLRATSNLAIAAPLMPDQGLMPRALTPSSLRSSLRPNDKDDDDDPFDPFATQPTNRSFHPITITDFDSQWSATPSSDASIGSPYMNDDQGQHQDAYDPGNAALETDYEAAALLTDGMTPFDVLSSVFGSTLAPSELEEALANNGYDFERAMAWLVDRALPTLPQHPGPQIRVQPMGGRVTLVSREGTGGAVRTGRAGYTLPTAFPARPMPRPVQGRPVQGGNRVCRYFVAGECLRADCRFSHDLERALCRFWLRGTCAKQDNCEFLHHLPKDVDVSTITNAFSRTNIGTNNTSNPSPSPPPDEYPALATSNAIAGRGKRGGHGYGRDEVVHHDPGRTRFAAAVKRAPQVPVPSDSTLAARREVMGSSADNLHHRSAIVAPRPSPRLKLRIPSLLPTLLTGESISSLYMAYRSRALQLGAARNACLSRAADAWRRGDGAAAKRFSREGHDLNTKMGTEMTDAAGKLVRERANLSEQAVKSRELSWSDDIGDRTARGRVSGGGLGVCLGIARKDIGGEGKLTSDERTETMLDLHGLHSNEATEILEEFLLSLEQEHFLGLAYVVVGEEKHTGTQDVARGASRARLATGVREWLHRWGYPWSERDGVICVDALTHA